MSIINKKRYYIAEPDAAELVKKKPYIINLVRKAFRFIVSILAVILGSNNNIIKFIYKYNARPGLNLTSNF